MYGNEATFYNALNMERDQNIVCCNKAHLIKN